jgi:hypothetical protein
VAEADEVVERMLRHMGTRVCRLRPPASPPGTRPVFCSPHRWTRDTAVFPHSSPPEVYRPPTVHSPRGYPQGYPHGVSACSQAVRGIHRVRLVGDGPRVGEPPRGGWCVSTFAQVKPVSAARFPRVGGREQTKEGRSGKRVDQSCFPVPSMGLGMIGFLHKRVHAEQSVLGSMLLSRTHRRRSRGCCAASTSSAGPRV